MVPGRNFCDALRRPERLLVLGCEATPPLHRGSGRLLDPLPRALPVPSPQRCRIRPSQLRPVGWGSPWRSLPFLTRGQCAENTNDVLQRAPGNRGLTGRNSPGQRKPSGVWAVGPHRRRGPRRVADSGYSTPCPCPRSPRRPPARRLYGQQAPAGSNSRNPDRWHSTRECV